MSQIRPLKQYSLPTLFKKFRNYMQRAREKELINNLHNYHGKNFPITYKKNYNFSQKWEESLRNESVQDELLEDVHPFYSVLCLIIVLLNSFAIWTMSFSRYFNQDYNLLIFALYQIMLALKLMDIVIKAYRKYQNEEGKCCKITVFLRLIYKDLFCLGYYAFLIIQGKTTNNLVEIIIQLLVIYLLWKQSARIYQKFKVNGQTIQYQNQLKILDLLINIFVQAHIFAIFLYSASKIDPDNSWANAVGINGKPIITQYIYSFYFACTTMLTIGYGDISPKNQAEVMVVVVVQIVGVLSFGYLVNEMGHTLSLMRKKQEQLQKDLQTISKMSKFYNLQKNLQQKAKRYLLANQMSTSSLKPSDQNSLLMKLNQELRTEITTQNYLSIVKSCIFFLCNWSKTFQLEVAKRLQKKLVSPNQKLGEMSGIERIFIIKKGKVQVFMNRFGSSSNQKKLLKIICLNPLSQVSGNIFGYTIAFSNRPVYLEAVAQQFTSTYSISKQDFLKCITYDTRDFQYYHQLKCKIDQSQFSEQWEAPSIKNSREHYIPSHIFLIAKYKKRLNMETNKRNSDPRIRRQRKKFPLINELRRKRNKESLGTVTLLSQKTLEFEIAQKIVLPYVTDKINQEQKVKSQQKVPSQQFEQSSQEKSQIQNSASVETKIALIHAKQFLKFMRTFQSQDEAENKKSISSQFQRHKIYSNFFVKNNVDKVLLKLTQQNYLERRVNK